MFMGGTTLTSGLGGRGTWTWSAATQQCRRLLTATQHHQRQRRDTGWGRGATGGGGRVGGGAADYQYSNLS